MDNRQHFLSSTKRGELEQELHERKTATRATILDRLAFAKSLGDLSENAEYHSSKDEQGKNEARIAELEHILKNAVEITGSDDGTVAVGSVVTLIRKDDGTKKVYEIVGPQETDLAAGKISHESPIGKALIGTAEGKEITVSTPKGTIVYKVSVVK